MVDDGAELRKEIEAELTQGDERCLPAVRVISAVGVGTVNVSRMEENATGASHRETEDARIMIHGGSQVTIETDTAINPVNLPPIPTPIRHKPTS